MKVPKPISAVIFDCDGVLVDSEPISNRVLIDMVNEWSGVPLRFDPITINGQSLSKSFAYVEEIYAQKLPANFEIEFRRRTYAAFARDIQPIPGVIDLLNDLDLPFCVASNGPREKMEINLKGSGLWPFFEGRLFSAYDIGYWKPDPALFIAAADFLGHEPEHVLVVEDSPTGIKAALNGGFQVVGFSKHPDHMMLDSRTVDVVSHYSDLNHFLRN
jgi:HAD superfamily hydrolase (TIGR01509 family)